MPDTPPQKIGRPSRPDKAPRQTGGRKRSLTRPLTDLFVSIGAMVSVVNQVDGQIIIEGAPRLAESLNAVAKDNPAVYKSLERMLTGSAWGGVFMASGAIAIPILANHGLLPFQLPGMESGDIPPADFPVFHPEPESNWTEVTPVDSESDPLQAPDIGQGYAAS